MTTADPPFLGERGAEPWSVRDAVLAALRRLGDRLRDLGLDDSEAAPRILFLMAVFAAASLILALGATHAALFVPGPPRHAAPAATRPDRADLVDRNGEILATDVIRYGLYLRPAEIADPAAEEAAIAPLLPRTVRREQLENALAGRAPARPVKAGEPPRVDLIAAILDALRPHRRARENAPDPSREFFVAGDLSPGLKDRLHDLALPGVDFQEEAGRLYPLGRTAAHLIGYASKDGKGIAGAERAFDGAARAGPSAVPLSIDLRVQAALQDEIEAAAERFGTPDAVGMVVNVRTGEILAMDSYPSMDPNAPASPAPPGAIINHAAASLYEPGSVFKVFTLAMVLDSGVAKLDTPVDVRTPLALQGQTIHDYDKADARRGSLTLREVFTHSSNIGAAKLSLLAGGERMEHAFRAFGLFARAPSELIESRAPMLQATPLSRNTVATYGFGHAISVSPLALATGMSAILNGGLYRPLTLRKLEPGTAPAPGTPVIKPETSRTMLDLMRLNAMEGTGRGADALAPGYRVGGKTGTATKLRNGRYNHEGINLASFAAVFPTDGPLDADRYLVLVMMDEPRKLPAFNNLTTGGVVAAPIAGRVIARVAPLLGVARVAPAPGVHPAKPLDLTALAGDER
jgi:cell division protein FtsI (penicillin-binding protein 3)